MMSMPNPWEERAVVALVAATLPVLTGALLVAAVAVRIPVVRDIINSFRHGEQRLPT